MQQVKDLAVQQSLLLGIKTLDNCEDYDSQYPQIELSDLEKSKALYLGRQQKFFQLEDEAKRKKREALEAEVMRPWTAEEMYNQAALRLINEFSFSANDGVDGKPVFTIDDGNRRVLELLSCYFTGDKRFEETTEGWSLNKGLMISGNIGLGKSLIMRLFSRNKRQSYVMVSCRTVGDTYTRDGADALDFYSTPREEAYGDPRIFYQRQLGYCFDDLGTEEIKSHYGNKVNIMADILLNRYDRKFEMPWNQTHLTTNLSADEIEEMYGSRVRSRLREMFNLITLAGKDRRK